MGKNLLKEMGFSDIQISEITEIEYTVIRNFFSSQEVAHIDKNQVIAAAKILAPVFKSLKIVDMFDYISQANQDSSNDTSEEETKPILVSNNTSPFAKAQESAEFVDSVRKGREAIGNEFDRYIKGRYLVQQVWILEHLVNNPNLLDKNISTNKVKRYLKEKETELKIHNIILQKFFESVNFIGDIYTVLNFKHFESVKKDLATRLVKFQNNTPLDFKGVVEILQDFGFEERQELNKGICSALAELVKSPKLQKLINYTKENLNEVDLTAEKKKTLRKAFKE